MEQNKQKVQRSSAIWNVSIVVIIVGVAIWAISAAYSSASFRKQHGDKLKTVDSPIQASGNTTASTSDLVFTVAMLGKSRKEIMAKHGEPYKVAVDQHFKDNNYIAYTWYNLTSYAYYFTNDSNEVCYRYVFLAFNKTKSTFDLSYADTHFRIEGDHWIDESDIFKGQEDKDPCHTRWEIKDDVNKNTDIHMVRLTATAFKYTGKKDLDESMEKSFGTNQR